MVQEYYGIASTPNDDFLAHYGVKGMKWGVRKAIASGDSRRLGRQFAKAQKKLAKLDKRAAKASKYAKRAALYGAGAAAAGGLAAAGTEGVSRLLRGGGDVARKGLRGVGAGLNGLANAAGMAATGPGGLSARKRAFLGRSATALKGVGNAMNNAGAAVGRAGRTAGSAVGAWGKSTAVSNSVAKRLGEYATKTSGVSSTGRAIAGRSASALNGVTNNTLARIGAGAVGVGLAGAAARNAYRAATAKKKAAKFRSEMNEAFSGTKYAGQISSGPATVSSKKKRRR